MSSLASTSSASSSSTSISPPSLYMQLLSTIKKLANDDCTPEQETILLYEINRLSIEYAEECKKNRIAEIHHNMVMMRIKSMTKPTPLKIITSTETFHHHDTQCMICLVEKINKPATTDCDHTFCQTCIKKHWKTNRACPICRSIIETILVFPSSPSGTKKETKESKKKTSSHTKKITTNRTETSKMPKTPNTTISMSKEGL